MKIFQHLDYFTAIRTWRTIVSLVGPRLTTLASQATTGGKSSCQREERSIWEEREEKSTRKKEVWRKIWIVNFFELSKALLFHRDRKFKWLPWSGVEEKNLRVVSVYLFLFILFYFTFEGKDFEYIEFTFKNELKLIQFSK